MAKVYKQDDGKLVLGHFLDDTLPARQGLTFVGEFTEDQLPVEPMEYWQEAGGAIVAVVPAEVSWAKLRAERDRRLAASDFTQLPDAPLSTAQKTEWQVYRQELRDLPENTADPANPAWPQPPVLVD